MSRLPLRGLCLAVLALAACVPAREVGLSGVEAPRASEARRESSKTITVAQLNPVKYYGPWDFSSTSGGGPSLAEVHTVGLVSEDRDGNTEPRLAAALPSLADGTVHILPDGRMQTTWKLRPGVTWHDGVAFTADDLVFSWEIAQHPDLVSSASTYYQQVDVAEAVALSERHVGAAARRVAPHRRWRVVRAPGQLALRANPVRSPVCEAG